MLALLLTTSVAKVNDYKENQILEWKTQDYFPTFSHSKLKDVKDVFIYFSKQGVSIHAKITEPYSTFLKIKVVKIINNPISLKELKQLGIVTLNDRLQGYGRYLNEESSETLYHRFYNK